MSLLRRRQHERTKKQRTSVAAICGYDAIRAVACEEAGVAYGPVAVPTGQMQVSYLNDGTRVYSSETDLVPSYAVSTAPRSRTGYLDKDTMTEARRDGYKSRTTQKDLRRRVGHVE